MDTPPLSITIDHAKCSGCSELVCIGVCPQGIIELDRANKPYIAVIATCTLCGVCANLCPAKAIAINSNSTTKRISM